VGNTHADSLFMLAQKCRIIAFYFILKGMCKEMSWAFVHKWIDLIQRAAVFLNFKTVL
jgi:hypothetical protein